MAGGRERILDTAYQLFSEHGTRAVGVDRIIAEAGTAKMTLYRNFASKEGSRSTTSRAARSST